VRAFVTAPPLASARGARDKAFGTWSRSLLVRTPNAPPSAPRNLRCARETLKETSAFIEWDEPALLHGGGLIDYEIKYRILAIGDVSLGRRVAGQRVSRREQRFFAALERKYHGDRRLSSGGVVVGRLWSRGHTLTPLLPATLVEFVVRAKNTEGWGEVTLPLTARTRSALPEAPEDVRASECVLDAAADGAVGGWGTGNKGGEVRGDAGEAVCGVLVSRETGKGRGVGELRYSGDRDGGGIGHGCGDGDVSKSEDVREEVEGGGEAGASVWFKCHVSWAPPPFPNAPLGMYVIRRPFTDSA